jgi:hypothetical protein
MRKRGTLVAALLSFSCHASSHADVDQRPAVSVAELPVLVDASVAAEASASDAISSVDASAEPSDMPLDCSTAILVPGTEWNEEIRANRAKSGECYGEEVPWLGHVKLTRKVLAANAGDVTDLRVRYDLLRDVNDDRGELEGRSVRLVRALGRPTLFAEGGAALPSWAVDEVMLDGTDVSDALRWPIPERPLKLDEVVTSLVPSAVTLLTRRVERSPEKNSTDWGRTQTITVRFAGLEERNWGKVRVFKASVRATFHGGGMCHHQTTTWGLEGTLAFPVHADRLVEARWRGAVETSEGLCQGCGKDHQEACPERPCGRGTFESSLLVSCMAPPSP